MLTQKRIHCCTILQILKKIVVQPWGWYIGKHLRYCLCTSHIDKHLNYYSRVKLENIIRLKHWCRRRGYTGCKRTPKSFGLFKIREKSLKIREKSWTILENSRKIWAKSMKMLAKYLKFWENYLKVRLEMPLNVVWFWCSGAQRGKNHMKTFFWRLYPKNNLCGRKFSHKDLPKRFSGKFGENRAKIFLTPKNLPAPISMGWNTMYHESSIYQTKYCKTTFLALLRLSYTRFNRPVLGKTTLLRQKSKQTHDYYRIATKLAKACLWKETFLSKESDTKTLQSIYFA